MESLLVNLHCKIFHLLLTKFKVGIEQTFCFSRGSKFLQLILVHSTKHGKAIKWAHKPSTYDLSPGYLRKDRICETGEWGCLWKELNVSPGSLSASGQIWGSYIRSSNLWTTQKPVLVSELESFIGKNVRLDCDDRARREDVKNI